MADRAYPSGIYPEYQPPDAAELNDAYTGGGNDPSYLSSAYMAMSRAWEPIKCCQLGTQYFREHAELYLPPEPRENEQAWKRRVSHAVMSPFLTRLVEQAAGLLLRKPIQLEPADGSDYVNPFFEDFILDVDGFGADINSFTRRLVVNSLLFGHSALLVDYSASDPARSLAEERALKNRPYFIGPIAPPEILGWRKGSDSPLAPIEQIRLNEYVTEKVGAFGDKTVRQVRVLMPGVFEVWRKGENGWYKHAEGPTSLDQIPLCVTYSNKVSELVSNPPLEPIANLNILQAQRQADLQHSLHVASMPVMYLKGWDDADNEIGLSANSAIVLPIEGDVGYAEPASSAFQAQQDFINQLENQMSSLGISTLFAQKNAAETAESKRLSRTDSDSLLQLISKDVEITLQKSLDLVGQYVGIQAPKVVIDRDLDLQVLDGQQIAQYLQLWNNGAICHETLLQVLQTGEVLPNIDIEEELEKTSQEQLEGQNMAYMTEEPPSEETIEIADSDTQSDVRQSVESRLQALAKPVDQQ